MARRHDLSPVELVQNPAFGSAILWHFGRGYQDEAVHRLPTLTLFFVVLPVILHARTLREVTSTLQTSGLGKFVTKLAEDRENLYAVHERALAMRALTLQSLATGVSTNLLSVAYATADVRANDIKLPRPPERLKPYFPAAEKLGHWCARVAPAQVFTLLQVYP